MSIQEVSIYDIMPDCKIVTFVNLNGSFLQKNTASSRSFQCMKDEFVYPIHFSEHFFLGDGGESMDFTIENKVITKEIEGMMKYKSSSVDLGQYLMIPALHLKINDTEVTQNMFLERYISKEEIPEIIFNHFMRFFEKIVYKNFMRRVESSAENHSQKKHAKAINSLSCSFLDRLSDESQQLKDKINRVFERENEHTNDTILLHAISPSNLFATPNKDSHERVKNLEDNIVSLSDIAIHGFVEASPSIYAVYTLCSSVDMLLHNNYVKSISDSLFLLRRTVPYSLGTSDKIVFDDDFYRQASSKDGWYNQYREFFIFANKQDAIRYLESADKHERESS